MKNNTLIVWVVFAFLLGLILKANIISHNIQKQQIVNNGEQIPKPEVNHTELICLAKNVYFEAGSEPLEGKQAVAQVVLNRMKHAGFPRTACGVVKQKTHSVELKTVICQFSWVCEGTKKVLFDSPAWGDSVAVAKIALTEKKVYDKFSSNVLFFHEKHLETNWKDKYKQVKVVGNHKFYRIKYANERRNKTV
jgi:spore germination cell wall hydrolase CwlJ-like protein